MSKVKKFFGNIFEQLKEGVKDSAKQVAKPFTAEKLADHILNRESHPDEFSEYLKNVGDPSLTGKKLEERQATHQSKDAAELERARSVIRAAMPEHMKLRPKPAEQPVYYKNIKERQDAVNRQAEAAAHRPVNLAEPEGKSERGSLFSRKKKRKPQTSGFEVVKKDSKMG